MKFLARAGLISLIVLFAVITVYTSLLIIASVNLDIGESADMGFVKYTKTSVSVGRLEIAGMIYNFDIFAADDIFQKYKNALQKADLFTPEILKFASFAK